MRLLLHCSMNARCVLVIWTLWRFARRLAIFADALTQMPIASYGLHKGNASQILPGCKLIAGRSVFWFFKMWSLYRVILKKVSFGIFGIFLVSKEEKNFTIKSKDKGLSLGQFSRYLVIVKIIKIRHLEGHNSRKTHDSKIIFMQK